MQRDRDETSRMLAEVSAALSSTAPELDAILQAAIEVLSRMRSGTWVAVFMNPDLNTSRMVAADSERPAMVAYVNGYAESLGRRGRTPTVRHAQLVIESREPILNPRMPQQEVASMFSSAEGADHAAAPLLPIAVDAAAVVVVPMRVGESIVGTLGHFEWNAHDQAIPPDAAQLQPVADRIALSLEHARLLDSTRDQLERLEALSGITLATRYGQDLRLTLRIIVEQVARNLRIDAADILLVTEPGEHLETAASVGFHSATPTIQLSIDAEALEARSTRPRVTQTSEPGRMAGNPRRTLFALERFQTQVSVPLLARNRLVGVLELFNRSATEWGQDWLDFFEVLAAGVAMAIDAAGMTAPSGLLRTTSAARPDFSEFELEILRLIVDGQTNREISQRFFRSQNTIKFHVRRILEKAGASNRTELARMATREGWL